MANVRIELDDRGKTFTCLDYMTGRVVMNINTEETISLITVKMEGVSRTRLPIPREDQRDSKRAEVEIHRFLYIVHTVFPSAEIRENTSASNSGYTLRPGQYEYPFRIRIPINTTCDEDPNQGGLLHKLSFEKGALDYAKNPTRHIKGTFPPSLSGIPGDEAWIRYYLKVTINRPQFYRLNTRTIDPFVFLPIEPPRPPPSSNETYAKRQHQMIYHQSPTQKKRGLFSAFRHHSPELDTATQHVHFSVEARLPAPPIIVPSSNLPFRILLVKLQPYKTPIIVRSLQIHLWAFTEISAHGIRKTDRMLIPVLSLGNLRTPLGHDDSPIGQELEADPTLWAGASLPDTVPPSFRACNIWRTYQLEVIVGVSHGLHGNIEMIPLIMPIQVYSGIAPPQRLLDSAVRNEVPPMLPPRTATSGSLKVPPPSFAGSHSAKNSPVSSPVSEKFPQRPHSSSSGRPWPAGVAVSRPHSSSGYGSGSGSEEDVLPPTYEDALADDIGPVDGPRRRYEQEGDYYGALPEDMH